MNHDCYVGHEMTYFEWPDHKRHSKELRQMEVVEIRCCYDQTVIIWSDGKHTINGTFTGPKALYTAGKGLESGQTQIPPRQVHFLLYNDNGSFFWNRKIPAIQIHNKPVMPYNNHVKFETM